MIDTLNLKGILFVFIFVFTCSLLSTNLTIGIKTTSKKI